MIYVEDRRLGVSGGLGAWTSKGTLRELCGFSVGVVCFLGPIHLLNLGWLWEALHTWRCCSAFGPLTLENAEN